MDDRPLDRIHIGDLLLRCIVGVRDWERREKQNVNVNITLFADLRTPGRTDRIEDTVDYVAIKKKVIALAENSSFYLIERLAQRIAETCLEDRRVERVAVRLEKPGALRFARTVSVEIVRDREHPAAG
ncbi:MAG: dihydroneopterin aldolase, partial [Planctomycetota bacterium]